jgi:hypothetical protein
LFRRGSSSPLLLAGGMGAAGLDQITAVILGFLSRQDEDLFDACLHSSLIWLQWHVLEGSFGELL